MANSLKQKLNDYIKLMGEADYDDIKQKCESKYFGKYYRITTAERRLRNESPNIEAVYQNGYIVKYKYKIDNLPPEERPIRKVEEINGVTHIYQ